MKVQLLIPAAGAGVRLGQDRPKALVEVGERPLIVLTLHRFRALGLVDHAVIVTPGDQRETFERVLQSAFPECRFRFAPGGPERQVSVMHGLNLLDSDTSIVVIHDAARPFVTQQAVDASIQAAAQCGAATVASPTSDTILEGDPDGFLVSTPDRANLWLCQTPQTFQVAVIRRAHEAAERERYVGTDDATLVRRIGGTVKLVPGTRLNFKITTPTDLAMAEWVIREGLA